MLRGDDREDAAMFEFSLTPEQKAYIDAYSEGT